MDHRTDLYSLGATLYEFLTLEPAFNGHDRHELLRQIAIEEPRPVRKVNKAVPADLETIVLKAMAKNPARALRHSPGNGERPATVLERRADPRQALDAAQAHAKVGAETPAGDALGGGGLARRLDRAGWQHRLDHARPGRAAGQVDRRDSSPPWKNRSAFRNEGKWPQAQAAAGRAEALLHAGAADPAAG